MVLRVGLFGGHGTNGAPHGDTSRPMVPEGGNTGTECVPCRANGASKVRDGPVAGVGRQEGFRGRTRATM